MGGKTNGTTNAGHSPKSITDYYGEPDVETLRPWVEQVYALLVGEVERSRIEKQA